MNKNHTDFPVYSGTLATLILAFGLLVTGCNGKKIKATQKDPTITPVTAITKLVLDSSYVEDFIEQEGLDADAAQRLRNFYISRNYQFAWFIEDGLAEQARAFWNLRIHYLHFNHDSTLYDKNLEDRMAQLILPDSSNATLDSTNPVEIAGKREVELQLTQNFFQYAQYAYAGKIDPAELQWHIPRKKLDPVALLDSLVKNQGANVKEWEPVNEEYSLMQKQLTRLAEIEKSGGWEEIVIEGKYRVGDTALAIAAIKKRLFVTGDLNQEDTTWLYDEALAVGIKQAQYRYGLNEDGIINESLVKELNVPARDRIQQVLINMERMRWLPKAGSGSRIVANIPEFKLHVFDGKEEVLNMNIVVGKAGTNSVIFTDELKYIVFSPYWNIPSSITRDEILPGMKRNANYLASKNMEITGYSNGLPVVRQKPGGSNSLGLVKFIFPNSYNIYFHDTPSKSLFEKEKRAFSHGCIRVQKPFELAKYLLRNVPGWTDEKIRESMHLQADKWVTLPTAVPVFITYFTAWVDHKGLLHFRDDIYGHDAKLKERLFR